MKKMYIWILVLVIVVVAIILSLKSKPSDDTMPMNMAEDTMNNGGAMADDISNTQTQSSVTTQDQTTTSENTTNTTTKSFTVTGQNFSFSPKSIEVNKGDTVNINFVNASGFHDFKLDEFGVATKQIGAGQQQTVTFVADKTGSFEYYCSVGNHRAMGMKGILVVK